MSTRPKQWVSEVPRLVANGELHPAAIADGQPGTPVDGRIYAALVVRSGTDAVALAKWLRDNADDIEREGREP